jgi:hypothetical protein
MSAELLSHINEIAMEQAKHRAPQGWVICAKSAAVGGNLHSPESKWLDLFVDFSAKCKDPLHFCPFQFTS